LINGGSTISETESFNDGSDDGKSWQYCSSNWSFLDNTKNAANSCPNNQTNNQTQNNTTNTSLSVELVHDSEVKNGNEFDVDIKLKNLQAMKYDIKIYITPSGNSTIISETDNDDEWKSGTYYVINATEGSGDKTYSARVRIKSDYRSFKGDADIIVKVRESASENSVAESKDSIKIAEADSANSSGSSGSGSSNSGTLNFTLISSSSTTGSSESSAATGNVIKLNPATTKTEAIKSPAYKSKLEYIKEYGIYAFALVCVIVIFIQLRR
jgi:hypothetical protein